MWSVSGCQITSGYLQLQSWKHSLRFPAEGKQTQGSTGAVSCWRGRGSLELPSHSRAFSSTRTCSGWDSLETWVLASYLGLWRSPLHPLPLHLSWRDCRPSPAKPSLRAKAARSGERVPATPRPLGSPHPASQQTYLQARSPRALVTLHSLPVGFSPMLPTTASRTYCLQERGCHSGPNTQGGGTRWEMPPADTAHLTPQTLHWRKRVMAQSHKRCREHLKSFIDLCLRL